MEEKKFPGGDPLVYNSGDAELETYLTPLFNNAGVAVVSLQEEVLRAVLEKRLLHVG